jgi:anti-sigma B factor antagonist
MGVYAEAYVVEPTASVPSPGWRRFKGICDRTLLLIRATWHRPLAGGAVMPDSDIPFDEQLLHVQREMAGLAVVLDVAGEIDYTTIGALRLELDAALALATPAAPVVVDLSRVTFFASAGLNELVVQHQRANEHRTPLRVVAAHRQVLRPIELTELHHVLCLFPDRASALRRPARQRVG